jgi:hypothetical protein
MGRSGFSAPMVVLLEQAEVLRPWLERASAPVASLQPRLDAAVEVGWRVHTAAEMAAGNQAVVAAKRAAWLGRFSAWKRGLDARLELVSPSAALDRVREAARGDKRRFGATVDRLTVVLQRLQEHAAPLHLSTWEPDLLAPGQALAAEAAAIVAEGLATDQVRADATRALSAATGELRDLLRHVRDVNHLCFQDVPIPFSVLDAWVASLEGADPTESRSVGDGAKIVGDDAKSAGDVAKSGRDDAKSAGDVAKNAGDVAKSADDVAKSEGALGSVTLLATDVTLAFHDVTLPSHDVTVAFREVTTRFHDGSLLCSDVALRCSDVTPEAAIRS